MSSELISVEYANTNFSYTIRSPGHISYTQIIFLAFLIMDFDMYSNLKKIILKNQKQNQT